MNTKAQSTIYVVSFLACITIAYLVGNEQGKNSKDMQVMLARNMLATHMPMVSACRGKQTEAIRIQVQQPHRAEEMQDILDTCNAAVFAVGAANRTIRENTK